MGFQLNPLSGQFDIVNAAGSGSGTVTSVGFSGDGTVFDTSLQVVTTSGVFTPVLLSQAANLIFASPNGTSGAPTWRSLVVADLPPLTSIAVTSFNGRSGAVTPQAGDYSSFYAPLVGTQTQITYYNNSTGQITSDALFSRDSTTLATTIKTASAPAYSALQLTSSIAQFTNTDGVTFQTQLSINNAAANLKYNAVGGNQQSSVVVSSTVAQLSFTTSSSQINSITLNGTQIILENNNISWFWPTADASVANQALVSNGSGVLSFAGPYALQTSLANYLPLAGGTMSGTINMGSNNISNVANPISPQDAINLNYLNTRLASYLPLAGGTMSGTLILSGPGTSGNDAVTYTQLTNLGALYLPLAGGTMTGILNMGGESITNLADPSTLQGAVTVNYLNNSLANYLQLSGGTMTGELVLNPSVQVNTNDAITVGQVNTALGSYLPIAGGTMTGDLILYGPGASGNDAVTYSQLISTGALYLPIAGGTMTGELVLNPAVQVNMNDAATIGQLVSFVSGLAWKSPAASAAATTNVVISSPVSNVFDSYAASNGDTIVLFNQTNNTENGIYVFNGTGTPMTRRSDANTSASLTAATIDILGGATYAGQAYTQIENNPVIGTSPIVFAEIGISYSASGLGIVVSGNVFSLKLDTVNTPPTLGIDSGNGLYVPNGAITATQLNATGITAGTYNAATVTVGTDGRIYSISANSSLVTSVAGLSGAIALATSTTGTDFTISTAGSTITFNLPSASATARGLITTGAQVIAGIKSFTNGIVIENDNTLTLNNSANTFSITLQAPSSLAASQAYVLPSTNLNTIGYLATVGTGGTMQWLTAVNSISFDGDGVIFNSTPQTITTSGTITPALLSQSANTFLAAPNGSSGTPTFRNIVAADLSLVGIVTTIDTPSGPVSPVSGIINFLVGSSGSSFAIVPSGNNITFDLPLASTTATGVINTGTQTLGGTKIFSKAITSGSVNGVMNSTLNVTFTTSSSGNSFTASQIAAEILDNQSHATDTLQGQFINISTTASTATLGTIQGSSYQINTGNGPVTNHNGIVLALISNATVTNSNVISYDYYVSSGSVTTAYGINGTIENHSNLNMTTVYGDSQTITNGGSGSILTAYNFYAGANAASTAYAFYGVQNPSRFATVEFDTRGSALFYDSGNVNFVGLIAPISVSSSLVYTLPATSPATGQILSSSSAGIMSWINAGGLTVGGTAVGFSAGEIPFIDSTGTVIAADSSFTHTPNSFTNITQLSGSNTTAYNQGTSNILISAEVSGTTAAQLTLSNSSGSKLYWSGSFTYAFQVSDNGPQIFMDASHAYTIPTDGTPGQVLTTSGSYSGLSWTTPSGSGTVTSVSFVGDGVIYNSTPQTVTTSGTFTPALLSQSANLVLASPNGTSGTPTFRAIVAADLSLVPYLSDSLTSANIFVGNGSNIATAVAMSGDVAITNTGSTTVNTVGGATAANIASTVTTVAAATPLNTPSTLVSRDSNGQIAATFVGTLGDGGTSTISMDLGSDASGDMYYRNAGGLLTRLAIGTTGQQLRVVGGLPAWQAATAGGTVTSVGLTVPAALFVTPVSGTPITTAGTFAVALATQTTNLVFASPNGSTGTPTFRALVAADIPAATLANGDIFVGNASNLAAAVAMSGGATITNAGVVSLGSGGTAVVANSFVYGGTTAGQLASTAQSANGQLLIGNTTTGHPTVGTLASGAAVAGFTVTATAGAGTITLATAIASQTANTFLAAPNGSAGVPSFRAMVAADFPASGVTAGSYSQVTVNTAGIVTGGSDAVIATTVTASAAITTATSMTVGTTLTVTGLTADSFIYSGTAGLITATASPTAGQFLIGAGTGVAPTVRSLSGAIFSVSATGVVLLGTSGAVVTPANSFMYGSTTAGELTAVTSTAAGQLLVSTGAATAPALVTMSGGATISAAGVVTLAGSPTFTAITAATITDSGLTSGGVVFAGTGGLLTTDTTSATALFWNNATTSLGIGTAAPSANLTVLGTATGTSQMLVRQFAGQTVDMADFQNSASTTIAKINDAGDIYAHHFQGLNTALPTVAVGAGAASTATVAVTAGGNDTQMIVTLTNTGVIGTASATLFTVTYNGTWITAPNPLMTDGNAAAAALAVTVKPFVSASSTTTFTVTANTVALPLGTYVFRFHSLG